MEGEITVISREDGSGTRGAFIELFGIEEKDESGEKEMCIRDRSMSSFSKCRMDIGSLGSIRSKIKSIVEPLASITPSMPRLTSKFRSFSPMAHSSMIPSSSTG